MPTQPPATGPQAELRDPAITGLPDVAGVSWGRIALCCTVMALAVDPGRPAHAYLDPGTGSIILQLLLGGAAGVAMVAKLYWHRLTSLFRRKDPDPDAQDSRG